MKNILIMDTETNGVDPLKDQVIELACVLWNIEHRSIVDVYSGLIPAERNDVEFVNKIPTSLTQEGSEEQAVWGNLTNMASRAFAFVAHNAEFDKKFTQMKALGTANMLPWICSIEDFDWPQKTDSSKLVDIALNHGVAVTSAHRALQDCLILARLFEAIPDIDVRLAAAYDHCLLEKAEFIANVSFAQKELAKAHGFKWNPDNKTWWKRMVCEDANNLPFPVRRKA